MFGKFTIKGKEYISIYEHIVNKGRNISGHLLTVDQEGSNPDEYDYWREYRGRGEYIIILDRNGSIEIKGEYAVLDTAKDIFTKMFK